MPSILLLNDQEELKSFPVSQKLILKLEEAVEEADYINNIVLFKLPSNSPLLNVSEKYAYNIGHIKENFDIIDVHYHTSITLDDKTLIEVQPKELLNPNSHYCLFVSSKLSEPYLTINKINSKSNSTINILPNTNLGLNLNFNLKITSTPSITNKSNIITATLTNNSNNNSEEIVLNLKQKNKYISKYFIVEFTSSIYDINEEFNILLDTQIKFLDTDYAFTLRTVSTSSVTPLPLEQRSNLITNEDILNFYQEQTEVPVVVTTEIVYEDINIFKIIFSEPLEKSDIDIDNLSINIKYAFNNYQIKNLDLFKPELFYILKILWDDYENCIKVIINYQEEFEYNIIDTSEW